MQLAVRRAAPPRSYPHAGPHRLAATASKAAPSLSLSARRSTPPRNWAQRDPRRLAATRNGVPHPLAATASQPAPPCGYPQASPPLFAATRKEVHTAPQLPTRRPAPPCRYLQARSHSGFRRSWCPTDPSRRSSSPRARPRPAHRRQAQPLHQRGAAVELHADRPLRHLPQRPGRDAERAPPEGAGAGEPPRRRERRSLARLHDRPVRDRPVAGWTVRALVVKLFRRVLSEEDPSRRDMAPHPSSAPQLGNRDRECHHRAARFPAGHTVPRREHIGRGAHAGLSHATFRAARLPGIARSRGSDTLPRTMRARPSPLPRRSPSTAHLLGGRSGLPLRWEAGDRG